jgi:phosphomevalonate kinase
VIVATAPAKLFLTGEWAVLAGAPAVVAALDRVVRVELDVEPGAGDLAIESAAEGYTWRGNAADGPLPAGDAGAVVAVLRTTGAVHGRVRVDSRAFLVGERKLGLGRSAATIAAATAACRARAGRSIAAADVLDVALAANTLFQDGSGSGADVAASVHGGVVEVRRGDARLSVTPRTLPTGVQLVAGWTGEPAGTAPLVARFERLPKPPVLAELGATAEAAAHAFAVGDVRALATSIARSSELLARLADETGLPIVTPALRRLVDAARSVGAVAKPSGAGGGDCGIALATSPTMASAVRAVWREVGILPLDVTIAREGAVVRG